MPSLNDLSTNDIDYVRVLVIISAVLSALFAVSKFIRYLTRAVRRIGHALDILIGVPRIGETPERPGVLARLAKIEAEVRPNHGTSMRDTVDTIKATSAHVAITVSRMEDRMLTNEIKFNEHLDRFHANTQESTDSSHNIHKSSE